MAEGKVNLEGVKVLLGVCGGISAYKAVDLASKLAAAGAEVRTAMTDAACELIGPKSFEAVTGGRVYVSLWSEAEEYEIGHVSLADWADVVAVVPATADIIGKMAGGICDDLVSTVLCACWEKKVLAAPAMNVKMWSNPAVRRNVEFLREMGVELIGPEEGRLACGAEGVGRMSEPADILVRIAELAAR